MRRWQILDRSRSCLKRRWPLARPPCGGAARVV